MITVTPQPATNIAVLPGGATAITFASPQAITVTVAAAIVVSGGGGDVGMHNSDPSSHPDLRTAINNKASPYVHSQTTLSTIWTINHGLGRSPSISITRSDGTRVIGTVVDNGLNVCSVVFAIAISGTAYCI